jgi:TonB family protein
MLARFFLITSAIVLFVGSGPTRVAAMSGTGPRGEPLSDRQVRQCLVSPPRIHYPTLSRRLRSRGSGLYEMRVETSTGKVTEVVILKSTGARILDIECIRALGHCRFKPSTVTAVRTPVTFKLSWRSDAPEEHF